VRAVARADVVVVGAGHNGLTAATLLARAGLSVVVLEERDVVGGAARTERPFDRVPGLRHSTGAYLLGLMPPELMAMLGLSLPLRRRDPHYFLPTTDHRYLMLGSDRVAAREQFEKFFSPADWAADERLAAELADLRADVAPAWLADVGPVEEVADRYVRPELQETFVRLCRGSVIEYLDRFGFESELVTAMYAVTDGLSGVAAGPDTPGTGHNFLVHNMTRLPGSAGTWLIVEGGMGRVTSALADLARAAGAEIRTGTTARQIVVGQGAVTGVATSDDELWDTTVVVTGCDPFRLPALLGDALPAQLRDRLNRLYRPGSTLKVNLALRHLPAFACLPADAPRPHGATVHLLPQDSPLRAIRQMWAQVQRGDLPEFPTIEWYLHTTVDPSLQDPAGHHSSALFVQSVPYRPAAGDWAQVKDSYVEHLLALCDQFAPGTSALVADLLALAPPDIEDRFGITGGHIHHVDNCVAFADRVPYRTGVAGLYAGSAGCHPAGSVIGAAGHNAAHCVLADLGRAG
jgi:phytoene dehydrogenase-like protein